ncbi:MAG: hypothetical protein JXA69_02675 [Phycisphaerae bacterium]|nr:hypothetical protein [Phycisphaerae bacterium]
MELYLDDQPVTVDDAETQTLQEVAEELRDQLTGQGRLLTTIRCDGREVIPAELEATLARQAGMYGSVEFQSTGTQELVRGALTEAAAMLAGTNEVRNKAADLLNEGQMGAAMEALSQCFQAWGQVHEAVIKSSQLMNIDLNEAQADGLNVVTWLMLLAEKLRDLKAALEADDQVSVADILRYEFDEVSEQWKRVFEHLIGQTQRL